MQPNMQKALTIPVKGSRWVSLSFTACRQTCRPSPSSASRTVSGTGAGFWLHTAAVAVLAVSVAAVADTSLQPVRVLEAANAVGMGYASVVSPHAGPVA